MTCPICYGKGWLQTNNGYKTCSVCDGEGEIEE